MAMGGNARPQKHQQPMLKYRPNAIGRMSISLSESLSAENQSKEVFE